MRHDAEFIGAIIGEPEDIIYEELENFYVCPRCGQAVDMRLLNDVLHHEAPGHDPLVAQ